MIAAGYPLAQALLAASAATALSLPVADNLLPFSQSQGVIYALGQEKADGVVVYDAVSTAGTTSKITSVEVANYGGFKSSDIGKICALLPYTNTGVNARYGKIIAVAADGKSCTASFNLSPGALTGATFVYGTDQAESIDALLAAANASPTKGLVFFPMGVICSSRQHIQPTGVAVRGLMNNSMGGKAKDFRHYGTSLILCGFQATGGFWQLGSSTSTDPRGVTLENLNIDCLNLAPSCIDGSNSGRTERLRAVTALRGSGAETYKSGPTSRVHNCVFIGQNQSNVVSLSGDSNFIDNIVTGAGNGYYGIKAYNGDDILIALNHIWKDAADSTMLGGSIWLSFSGSVLKGSVTVALNKCDTNYGSAIKISMTGVAIARDLAILQNDCFNNDSVTNNTGPVIELSLGASCEIRALRIQGNGVRASWNDPTKGQWTSLIDGTGIAGTISASHVAGNIGSGVNALYTSFTPTIDGGNAVLTGNTTTLVKSTIA